MNKNEITGRYILIALFVLLIILELCTIAHKIATFTERIFVITCIRELLTAGLIYAVYSGRGWAKRIMAVLIFLGSSMMASAYSKTHSNIVAAMLLYYLGCLILLLSGQVKAFMLYQKQKREGDKT